MKIREIRVSNLRSYELFSAQFDPELTLILGPNGTGKTSLLEAVYFLCAGTSFRGRDREMIAHDSTRADIVLELEDESRRGHLQLTADDKVKKTFEVRGKTTQRLPVSARLPIVLFEPEELRLLTSSPERRRRFIDGILSRLYPQYATVLGRYQRTLLQRNELLKRREDMSEKAWSDQLFVWDLKFADLALEIVRQRREFAVTSNSHLSRLYSEIAGDEHHITVSYHSTLPDEHYQQKLLDRLHANRVADSYRGYTSVGPHRDDFLLSLDGHLAAETASRGEMRSIMLAYKLLEVQLQYEATDSQPLILLDDVFSELDSSRERALMSALAGHQTIITATDLRDSLKSHGMTIDLSIS